MKIAAIPRALADSPNMSEKDMALFRLTVEKLSEEGHCTVVIEDGDEIPAGCDAIFHMTRTAQMLDRIAAREKEGAAAINSAAATRNCSRITFTEILTREGIEQPPYTLLDTSMSTTPALRFPGWLKKSDGWSSHPDDVQYIATKEALINAIGNLRTRGIDKAIYSEHIEGDIVKFYGIGRNDNRDKFFRLHYPTDGKFGHEKINGVPHKYPFDEEKLRTTVFKAAAAIGVEIFGGDCIISPDGEIYIIDINDCPSFSAYREEAAEEIVRLITSKK